MSKVLELPPDRLVLPRTHGFHDDFAAEITDGALWTKIATDSGTILVMDGAGGVAQFRPSDGTVADNDEVYLHSTNELFLFADDKPLELLARIAWAEANTDDANVLVGLLNAFAANHLQDDGAGPPASYSGACFFKVDGETQWRFETSLAGTQTTTLLSHTTPNAATDWHTLKIKARRRDATTVELVPFIDEAGGMDLKQCTDDATGALVKHTITLGSPTEMNIGVGVKNGGANNEDIRLDYLGAYQKR